MSEDVSAVDDGIGSLKEIQERLLDEKQEDVALTIGGYTALYIGSALGPFLGQIGPGLIAVGTTLHNITFGRKLKRIGEFHWRLISELQRIINELRGKIEGLEERVREKVSGDDFEYLYTRTLDSIASKQRGEKSEFYRNLLINHLITTDNNIDREELFLNLLDELCYSELYFLSLFPIEDQKIITPDPYYYFEPSSITVKEIVDLSTGFTAEDLFLTSLSLRARGLIRNVIQPRDVERLSDADVFLTDHGALFIRYIKNVT